MFRSSELVGLRWQHIHFCADGRGAMLYVPSSKTDPGEGAWVFIAAGPTATTCPVQALRRLRELAYQVGGAIDTRAVFCRSFGQQQALSKTTVGIRLKKALAQAGVRAAHLYAAHSLRRGGATHAAATGVPTRLIQAMGRWKSDAVRQYLYCTPAQLFQASQHMQATAGGPV
jgi:integrase